MVKSNSKSSQSTQDAAKHCIGTGLKYNKNQSKSLTQMSPIIALKRSPNQLHLKEENIFLLRVYNKAHKIGLCTQKMFLLIINEDSQN